MPKCRQGGCRHKLLLRTWRRMAALITALGLARLKRVREVRVLQASDAGLLQQGLSRLKVKAPQSSADCRPGLALRLVEVPALQEAQLGPGCQGLDSKPKPRRGGCAFRFCGAFRLLQELQERSAPRTPASTDSTRPPTQDPWLPASPAALGGRSTLGQRLTKTQAGSTARPLFFGPVKRLDRTHFAIFSLSAALRECPVVGGRVGKLRDVEFH